MHTSRAQVDRILDPDKGKVTIETLQRAAALVGRQLRFELVCCYSGATLCHPARVLPFEGFSAEAIFDAGSAFLVRRVKRLIAAR